MQSRQYQTECRDSFYRSLNIKIVFLLFLWRLFQRFSETKPFLTTDLQKGLIYACLKQFLRRFGRGIKFIYRQFTLVIARPKRCRKPLQTLIDGNLGNVSAGVLISEVAY